MASDGRRILYVVNAFERDAPTMVTAAVAKALAEDGWTVAMVAWSRGGGLECELDGARILTDVLKGLRALALAKWIREFRPDVVHSILVRPTLGMFGARVLLPGRKFRWIAGDHGVHEWAEKGRIIAMAIRLLMPAALQVSDCVVTVSNAAKKRLAEKGIARDRIAVVPNGVDASVFCPRSRAEKCAVVTRYFPKDDPWEVWPLIGSAGNLRPVKDFALLVSAMSEILAQWPGARLIVWGEGPELAELEQLAMDFLVEDAVKFVGRADHIEKLLPLLDLYVQPSLEESFGMAVAEAMSCGVPAILSDAGGLVELADAGRAARLFRAGNAGEFLRETLAALDDKPSLQKQGAVGREWVLQNYTTAQMVARMKQIYDGATNRGGVGKIGGGDV